MSNNKNTKKALLASTLSIVLCFAMLIGSTFAWFTDSITTGVNSIVAGNLNIDLVHVDGGRAGEKGIVEGEDVSLKAHPEHKIFDYDKWEPGYTTLETLKVENKGNLALKFRLDAVTTKATSGLNGEKLADVIDVWVYEGTGIPTTASFTEMTTDANWRNAGSLSTLMADSDGIAHGALLPEGATAENGEPVKEAQMTVALHMQESAGNAYQGLSLGDLNLTLYATQYTFENDSFGNQYDEKAGYLIVANTVADLTNAIGNLNAGDSVVIEMNADIGVNDRVNIPEDVTVVLDLKNHKIGHETTEKVNVTPLVNSGNLTVRNAEICSKNGATNASGQPANAALSSNGGNLVLEKCKLNNFSGNAYGSYCVGISGGTVTLNDCTIDGYRGGISLSGNAVMTASNCTINAQFYYPLYLSGQSTANFTNCTFNKCKVDNPLNPNQRGNGALIYDGREGEFPIAQFDTCIFNSTWTNGQPAPVDVPLEIFGTLSGMNFTNCTFGSNITGLPAGY